MSQLHDLESKIMECWGVVDDVWTVAQAVMDYDASTDEIANMLIGIQSLYNVRFQQLQDQLSQLIAQQAEQK